MESKIMSLDFALDGKVHVFFFVGTNKSGIRFTRIDDLDAVHPHDQLDAAVGELFPNAFAQAR
jgi:hypothetical protein